VPLSLLQFSSHGIQYGTSVEKTFVSQLQNEQIFEDFL